MISQFDIDSKGVYCCPALDEFVWQKHGFGSRQANPAAEITLRQIHSDRVWKADALQDREAEGDALVTDQVSRSIGIRTADCVPILLLDSRNRAVAAVHAGWRGTASQIVVRAVEKLHHEYQTDPADLYAAIGPCIRPCCYQVGPDVAARLEQWLPISPGNYRLDLAAANLRQMQESGLREDRVFDCGLCTSCLSDQLFSYRREPANPGRMLAAICRISY